MEYRHKSGALKRKEKREKYEKASKGQKNLLGFFSSKKDIGVEEDNEDLENYEIESGIPQTPTKDVLAVDCEPSTSNFRNGKQTCYDIATVHTDTEDAVGSCDIASSDTSKCMHTKFDIGSLTSLQPNKKDLESAVVSGPELHPTNFPSDSTGRLFPTSLLSCRMPNNEVIPREWLVWSNNRQALFCFPCRLFSLQPESVRSRFASINGYSKDLKWKKLYDKIPEHQNSSGHKECYLKWKNMETLFENRGTIFQSLETQINDEISNWKQILNRLLDVTLFLSERGLPFRGVSNKVGDSNNGNFLGLLELLSHYDPVLATHLERVQQSYKSQKKLQAHYLSWEIQNEFISCCADHVRQIILGELKNSKYYSIIVDATPDSSHVEQTSFVIRYVGLNDISNEYEIQERFLEFTDCNEKTGQDIANLIKSVLEKSNIPIEECRGQGYDNGSNMSGAYQGVQALILKLNPLAKYSPCGCHSLNLCGVSAAECCSEVQTFFGMVHHVYNLFSCSPKRWEILKGLVGSSLHSLSDTRWSARVDCVKPIAAHTGKVAEAVSSLLKLNIPVETRATINGLLQYLQSFQCIIMASVWVKILTPINYRSQLLQSINATLDVEVYNIESLIGDLLSLRNNFEKILSEAKLVAAAYEIKAEFPAVRARRVKSFHGETESDQPRFEPEERFRIEVFYKLIDVLVANLTSRFTALQEIQKKFSFLWKYQEMNDGEIEEVCGGFSNEYAVDVSPELTEEVKYLKSITKSNISDTPLPPLKLLNKLSALKITSLFPNVCIALRIFCTLPVSVAQAERSFSVLSRIKNCLRSTMGQQRLSDLGVLSIESRLARTLNFDSIIQTFAEKKARRVLL